MNRPEQSSAELAPNYRTQLVLAFINEPISNIDNPVYRLMKQYVAPDGNIENVEADVEWAAKEHDRWERSVALAKSMPEPSEEDIEHLRPVSELYDLEGTEH